MTNINESNSSEIKSASGVANVRFGVYNQPAPIAGKSIKDTREQFGRLWGIPTDAIAYKGKDKLDENYVVQPGDNVEFHRRAGEKG
ncbi:hypothetical protein [Flavobacterium sp.]|jgi:hypothetical protein|uniref:hypothetical protein n=1 Tax=Flavobacterium sp. TaxID=239 RepID=UPI003BE34048